MRQIIAIGGGGFGREIGELKIERYIKEQSNKKILKYVLFQQQPVMMQVILKIFIKHLIH